MSALSINVPFPVFNDRDGEPLEAGYVWIGEPYLDPQANPVAVYFDDALTIQAPQPLRTLNGYVSRQGSPAQLYIDGVNFSILVHDSKGTMVYNFPDGTGISPDASGVAYTPGADSLMIPLAPLTVASAFDALSDSDGQGAALVGYLPAGTGAVATDVQGHLRNLPYITNYAGITADGSDQTATIVAWLNTLGIDASGLYAIPYNCKFQAASVMAAMPSGVIFLDLSGLNSYAGVGDTAKRIGLFAKDLDSNDSAWQIASGHNAVLQFNNFGIAGTTSAAERVQGLVYSSGMYQTGSQGYREMAEVLLKRSGGNDWFEWNWNILAPWTAIAVNYERWATGVAAVAGTTRVLSNFGIYVAATSGTTGGVAPVHTDGTVSDGGVSWTFERTAGATVFALDEFGRSRINGGASTTDLVSYVQHSKDPATSAVVTYRAKKTNGTARFVQLALEPTDGATPSVVTPVPVVRATANVGLQVIKSDGSAALATFDDESGAAFNSFRSLHKVSPLDDISPSVAGVGTLYVENTGTNITALDDGSDGQIVTIVTLNANTSFVHSSTLMLTGSVDYTTPPAFSSITFQKVPSSISNRWIEISRSRK